MTIKEAVTQRHMVRKYIDKPIPAELIKMLNARVAENNTNYDLSLKLVTENSDGIGGVAKLFLTKTVYNYIILAGKDCTDLDENLGYCGADLILYAQTLGLNTWWCGGMFNGKGALRHLENASVRVNGVIAIGYGQTQGVPHKSKTAAQISQYSGRAPQWFINGVDALLYAPTALNKQPYTVRGNGNTVTITAGDGHFAGIDLGLV